MTASALCCAVFAGCAKNQVQNGTELDVHNKFRKWSD